MNRRGPPFKAKYCLITNSECKYCEGKVEKNSEELWNIEIKYIYNS